MSAGNVYFSSTPWWCSNCCREKPEKLDDVDTHMCKECPEDVCSKGGRWGIAGCWGFSGPKEWMGVTPTKTKNMGVYNLPKHYWPKKHLEQQDEKHSTTGKGERVCVNGVKLVKDVKAPLEPIHNLHT